jgi:nucleoside 2-deoxyribosyltransferase
MHIYLAAQYRRRLELCEYKTQLEALGHHVTSRWLLGAHEALDNGHDPFDVAWMAHCAQEDVNDIAAAQVVIAFTEPPRSTASRGGRHVELGYAQAWGKQVVICGPRENVFCALPKVQQYDSFAAYLNTLKEP